MDPTSKSSDPPETDLEYYARPENYTGSSLNTLTKFLVAKERQTSKKKKVSKKKEQHSEEKKLFRRYRHILSPDFLGLSSSSSSNLSSSSSESDDESKRKQHHPKRSRHRKQLSQQATNNLIPTGSGSTKINSNDVKFRPILSNTDNLAHSYPPLSTNGLSKTEKGVASTDNDKTFSDCSTDSGVRLSENDVRERHNDDVTEISSGCEASPFDQATRTKEADTEVTEVKFSPSPSLGESRASVTSLYSPRKKGSLAKVLSVKSKLSQLSKNAKRKVQVEKFRRVCVGIVNVLKLAKAIIKPTDSPSALLNSFTPLSREEKSDSHAENMRSYGLHFDPSYYKANKEISVSTEVKSILSLPPKLRTPEQIQTAMFGLQSLPSFAEYPLHMQEKLTKVAWFEIVTPMRTIIRQGHFAENFYFILSGKALVTLNKPGEAVAKTAAMMRKGTSFGELALLHHSMRTATVTSHDTVQLLSIGREDFFDIFMAGHGAGEMPEHIKFVSQLEFMKDWPIERLLERPDQCLLHFFKRNTVILRDSKASDWFYIVKSGSCQVLKELRHVTGRGVVERHQPKLKGCLFDDTGAKTTSHQKQLSRNGLSSSSDSVLKDKRLEKETTSHQDHNPVFVHMEVLKPKDVFGLDLLNFYGTKESTSSSVSLVSLGAECIMLSKAFFIKHANDKVKKRLSEMVTPYPDESSMQQSLQNKADWEFYKRSVVTEMNLPRTTGLRGQPLTVMW